MLSKVSLQNKEDEKIFINSKLFGLMIRCPLNNGPHENCPFREHRAGGSLEDKYSFIEDLSETSRLQLLALHNRCFELQTGNFLRFNSASTVSSESKAIGIQ